MYFLLCSELALPGINSTCPAWHHSPFLFSITSPPDSRGHPVADTWFPWIGLFPYISYWVFFISSRGLQIILESHGNFFQRRLDRKALNALTRLIYRGLHLFLQLCSV